MADADLDRTPSKKRGNSSVPIFAAQSHSSMEADAEAPDLAFQSAYTAPPYPRPQADRDHQQESLVQDRERGDLTAYNLELIPNADHVAPGIRLDRGGNDYPYLHRKDHGKLGEEEGDAGDSRVEEHGEVGDEGEEVGEEGASRERADKRSSVSGKTPSSIDATGRSSTGAMEMDERRSDGNDSDGHEMFEDVNEGDEDEFDEEHLAIVHERVGGSGATSENASKGTSVGHFGPRGEAIRESATGEGEKRPV